MSQALAVSFPCQVYYSDQNRSITGANPLPIKPTALKLKLHETLILFSINHTSWLYIQVPASLLFEQLGFFLVYSKRGEKGVGKREGKTLKCWHINLREKETVLFGKIQFLYHAERYGIS